MRLVLNLLVIALVLGSLQSCVSKKKFDDLMSQKEATDQALAETQGQLKTLQDEKDQLEADFASEKEKMQGDLASLRSDLDATKSQVSQVEEKLSMTEKELADLKSQINGIFSAYEESGLSIEDRDGKLVVMTKVPVNYRSGSAYLSRDERDALTELAETLKNNPEVKINVEGHTDDDQLIEGASFKDNWELGYARAINVVRFLVRNGVNPNQLAAVTKGETEPLGDNETSDGKAQNRRTDVTPNPDLSNVIKNN
ncbi:MAG: OmpA family protein [Bacteroidota bacterium]